MLALALALAALPATLVDALDQHHTVRAARRVVESAEAAYELQKGLLLDPTLSTTARHDDVERGGSFQSAISGGTSSKNSSLNSSISWLTRRGVSFSLSVADSRNETNSALFGGDSLAWTAQGTFAVSWPLDAGKRDAMFAGLDRAALDVVDSHLALEEARQRAAFEVVSVFWQCMVAEATVEVRRAALEEAEQREREVEARIIAGSLPPSDRSTFRSQTMQLSSSLLEGEVEEALCRDQAALLFGRPVPDEWLAAVAALSYQDVEIGDPVAVERARLAVQRARVSLDEALAADRADWDLSASYGLQGESDRHRLALENVDNPSWGVAITWSKRLGPGGLNEAASRVALEGADEDLDRARDDHGLESRRLADTVALRARALEASQAAVEAAEVARDAVRARWAAGLTSSLELFAAETRLLTARVDALGAESRLRVAEADLARYARSLAPAA